MFAFNEAAKKGENEYLILAHDDMYFCPNWDNIFLTELKQLPKNSDFFYQVQWFNLLNHI